MLRQSWNPSSGLRTLVAVRSVSSVGVCYVVLRYLFPHVLLIPVTTVFAVACLAGCLARFRVLLDPEAGQVAVTYGPWTRWVPLAEIEQVDEVLRFGTEIRLRDGVTFSYSPLRRRRRLGRLLRIRTGFEDLDLSVAEAAAAARSATTASSGNPDTASGSATPDAPSGSATPDTPPVPPPPASRDLASRHPVLAACALVSGALFLLAVTALVHEQTGGWLVHAAAVLLRACAGAGGIVMLLFGSGLLYRSLRRRPAAGQPNLS